MENYKIEDVEGIDPVIDQKMRDAGINDTDSLLENTLTPTQRKTLAEKAEVSPKLILRFANMVDLYRIHGVGSEYSELLEAAGVDTVPELAQRNTTLAQAMATANEEKKLTRRVPGDAEVAKWIEHAKTLPRKLQY